MNEVLIRRCPWWWMFGCWFTIIIIIGCWWWPKPAADCFDANLIIEDETTAAWAVTNNSFADGFPAVDGHPSGHRSFWTGMLFQFGQAAGAEVKCSTIQFYVGGSLVYDPSPEEVDWINIVADVPGLDPPVDIDHYFLLDGGCSVVGGCTRCRRVHAGLDPSVVMTYWQGPEGIAFEAEQGVGSFNAFNEQRFDFKDEFSAVCYKIQADGTLDIVRSFAVGELDEIRVKNTAVSGPGGGVKQDPPWSGP